MAKICRRTGKTNYRSETEALSVALQIVGKRSSVHYGRRDNMRRAYRCPLCPYWHVTSQEQRTQPRARHAS